MQTTNSLALALTEANFIQPDDQFGETTLATESSATIKKTLSWHLFKGGLKIGELENASSAEAIVA